MTDGNEPREKIASHLPSPGRIASTVWIIVGLLFLIRLVNYLDRQTISVLKSTLKAAFHFGDSDYSNLILAFMLPYIIMYFLSGWIIEALGTRKAMTLFASIWSIAGIASGLAQSFGQLAASRLVLGAAEPTVFPLSQRVILDWVPQRRRAFAMSIVSPSGSVGALIAPPVVAYLTITYSWRAAFIVPGILGLLLAFLWWRTDGAPNALAPAESPVRKQQRMPVSRLLRDRSFWGIITARIISDPVWFFFLFWIPGYLQERLGLTLAEVGFVGGIPYLAALVLCPLVGRIVDAAVARGKDPATVQLWVFSITAAMMPLGMLITQAPNVVVAVAIITIVTANAQIWFAGTNVIMAATLPHQLNASAAGFIGALGATAGLLMNLAAGPIIENFDYATVFGFLAILHPIAALVLWRTVRRGRRVSRQA